MNTRLFSMAQIVIGAIFFLSISQVQAASPPKIASHVNGIWVGFYEQRSKKTAMVMVLHRQKDTQTLRGDIIDHTPLFKNIGYLNAELDDIQFENNRLTFVKNYNQSPEALMGGFSANVDYNLRVVNEYEMEGQWRIGDIRGRVFFRKITGDTMRFLSQEEERENNQEDILDIAPAN